MRAAPHSPAYAPAFDQTVIRGMTKQYRNNGSLGGLPVFSWPGQVNFTDISPNWVMLAARDLTSATVVQADGHSLLGISILVNEITVESMSVPSTYKSNIAISVTTHLNDTVRLILTDFGTGAAENLTVALY